MTSKKSRKVPKSAAAEMLLWLALSFVLMLFLTRSSFLYPYNNWDDSNSYFSMGKSMFHGALIYRDLFDQKGPYLYFLYGLCSLISRTTFRGVFIMEVLLGAADLALLCRILKLFCRPRTSLVLTPFLFTCMCASKSFYWGGCAEEVCLPFLLLTFYIMLKNLLPAAAKSREHDFVRDNPSRAADSLSRQNIPAGALPGGVFPARQVFIAGLCCGFVFNVKFTLMGFFLGFAVIVIISCRSFREFLRLAGWFLLGVLIPFIPWLVYFGIRGGLDDWYRVYIYTNVFRYSSFGENTHGETAASRVYDLAKILYWLIRDNIQYFIFIIIGLFWMLVRPLPGKRSAAPELPAMQNGRVSSRERVLLRIAPVLLFALTFFFIYIGGAHLPYYAFPLTVFAVTGMAALGRLADRAVLSFRKTRQNRSSASAGSHNRAAERHDAPAAHSEPAGSSAGVRPFAVTAILLCASLAASFVIYRTFSWNRDFLLQPKDSVFLSRFTDDINRDRADGTVSPDHTTLLNVGCLDCGLYTTADIYPSCYWFQTQTLPGNEVTDAQNSYILEGRTDYVVVRDAIPESIYILYEQIDSFHQRSGEYEFDYYLFRKKAALLP